MQGIQSYSLHQRFFLPYPERMGSATNSLQFSKNSVQALKGEVALVTGDGSKREMGHAIAID